MSAVKPTSAQIFHLAALAFFALFSVAIIFIGFYVGVIWGCFVLAGWFLFLGYVCNATAKELEKLEEGKK